MEIIIRVLICVTAYLLGLISRAVFDYLERRRLLNIAERQMKDRMAMKSGLVLMAQLYRKNHMAERN